MPRRPRLLSATWKRRAPRSDCSGRIPLRLRRRFARGGGQCRPRREALRPRPALVNLTENLALSQLSGDVHALNTYAEVVDLKQLLPAWYSISSIWVCITGDANGRREQSASPENLEETSPRRNHQAWLGQASQAGSGNEPRAGRQGTGHSAGHLPDRNRPHQTVEHIAQRTGKPVEFFLAEPIGSIDETQAALAELEAMVGDGRFAEAVAVGSSLLDLG